MLCYNCKQPGHLSKDCKEKKTGRRQSYSVTSARSLDTWPDPVPTRKEREKGEGRGGRYAQPLVEGQRETMAASKLCPETLAQVPTQCHLEENSMGTNDLIACINLFVYVLYRISLICNTYMSIASRYILKAG